MEITIGITMSVLFIVKVSIKKKKVLKEKSSLSFPWNSFLHGFHMCLSFLFIKNVINANPHESTVVVIMISIPAGNLMSASLIEIDNKRSKSL